MSTASPLLVLLAHSEPDFLARRRSGCPQQLFLPSPKPGGHRCCQQEALSFQVTAREMGPFPAQPPIRGWGLLSASCLGPQERWWRWAGRVRRGAFPGPRGASYSRCVRSHHSLQPVSRGPLVLPNGTFPARATHSAHTSLSPTLYWKSQSTPRPHLPHLLNGLSGGLEETVLSSAWHITWYIVSSWYVCPSGLQPPLRLLPAPRDTVLAARSPSARRQMYAF